MGRTFRSLRGKNYRTWAIGAIVSNIGTWMQRTAQDWLVLAQLTDHRATAVGTVMALQFAPQVLLLPFTGSAADHFDRRKVLFLTQASMGVFALGLGLLTVLGVAQLWHVYVFAFLLGCATAFDAPARHAFVSDLVDEGDVSNAVALNSMSFSAARMIGPAIAGVVIAAVGSGWVFLLNAASFVAVLVSLVSLRVRELRSRERRESKRGGLLDGARYIQRRPGLRALLVMMFLFGTFGLNFPIYISTMAVSVFHQGPGGFGLLTSFMAVGSVSGALVAAREAKPRVGLILGGTTCFGVGLTVAALAPSYLTFGLALALVGVAAQGFISSVTAAMQLSTDPEKRGRVMAIVLAITLGGTPIGAPIVGWVADRFGARWGLAVGAAAGFAAALVGLRYLVTHCQLRVGFTDGRLRATCNPPDLALAS
jgi:MFS family permease